MTDKQRELTNEELEQEGASEFPEREEMALIDANIAAPVNAAVAANVLTEDSIANAEQTGDIDQSTS